MPPPGVFCTGEALESYAFLPSATVSRGPAQVRFTDAILGEPRRRLLPSISMSWISFSMLLAGQGARTTAG